MEWTRSRGGAGRWTGGDAGLRGMASSGVHARPSAVRIQALAVSPLAFDGSGSDIEHGARLLDSQPPRVIELDDSRLTTIDLCELLECLVQNEDVRHAARTPDSVFVETRVSVSAAFGHIPLPGVVHEYSSHHGSGQREQVGFFFPVDALFV